MYCKECGSQMPENVNFCPKCGAPAGIKKSIGSMPGVGTAKKHGKRNRFIAGIAAVVFLSAIAAVGILFAIGRIGNKGVAGRTETTESPVQAEAGQPKQEQSMEKVQEKAGQASRETGDKSAEDKAWEAYAAYKKYVNAKIKGMWGAHEGVDRITLDQIEGNDYEFVCVDGDDYPELFTNWRMPKSGAGMLTYQNGKVVELPVVVSWISYREQRQGYIFAQFAESGSYENKVYVLKNGDFKELYFEKGEYTDGDNAMIGKVPEKIGTELGFEEGTWKRCQYERFLESAFLKFLDAERKKW